MEITNMKIEIDNMIIEIDKSVYPQEEIRKIIQHPTGRYALLTSFRVIPIDILSIRKKGIVI